MADDLRDTQIVVPAPEVKVSVTKTKPAADPPLISFQITNPITYLKSWWKKLIGTDGIKLTIQIKPVTALLLALVLSGAGFSVGRLVVPEPLIQYFPILASPTPVPSPDPWKETAFTGKLAYANDKYFLSTTSAEAITLEVPATINLKPLIGKRILVIGKYNKTTKVMVVTGTPDLEILTPTPIPIPTIKPSPAPSIEPSI